MVKEDERMKKSKKKIVIIILLCVLAAVIAGWWALSVSIYNDNFNKRFESYEPYLLHVEDYEGLSCSEYTFPSDKGQKLQGYWYSAGDTQKGIIVIAHGFGAGHNSYMDCANFFAQNGYYVFAYDATGNDKSEGDGVAVFRRDRLILTAPSPLLRTAETSRSCRSLCSVIAGAVTAYAAFSQIIRRSRR